MEVGRACRVRWARPLGRSYHSTLKDGGGDAHRQLPIYYAALWVGGASLRSSKSCGSSWRNGCPTTPRTSKPQLLMAWKQTAAVCHPSRIVPERKRAPFSPSIQNPVPVHIPLCHSFFVCVALSLSIWAVNVAKNIPREMRKKQLSGPSVARQSVWADQSVASKAGIIILKSTLLLIMNCPFPA